MNVEEYRKLKPATLEDELARQLDTARIAYERQFKFAKDRRWRADFLLRHFAVLIEVDGGIFSKPKLKVNKKGVPYMSKTAHSSPVGIREGMKRANEAQILGYRIFRFDTDAVKNGEAMETIFRAIGIDIHKNNQKGKSNHG